MPEFDIVSPAAIQNGDATDAYFDRTVETLETADRNPRVTAEVAASQFPDGGWSLLAGLKDVAHLLADRPVDVDSLREGQLFDGGPVVRIEGPYLSFCRFETALLGFLSQATAFATAALEARLAAPDSLVLSFGSRHLHPSLAATLERSALLAGLDGISNVAAGEVIGSEAGGTMPHALMICFGDGGQEAAWRAFDEAVAPDVPRIALCDTYGDETQETIRAATAVDDLDGVRLDTTGSRRGDFEHILREVRRKLDRHGHENLDIFASGGLTPATMRDIRDVADGFGVGSHITSADPVDFALDIVTVDGESAVKRGKLGGPRAVYRTSDGGHRIEPEGASVEGDPLFEPLIRDGEIVREFDIDAAAERAVTDAERVGFGAVAAR